MTLSIKEACTVLGISRATIYRKMHTGELKCSRTAPDGVGHQSVTFTPQQLGITEAQIKGEISLHDVPVNAYYEGAVTHSVTAPPCAEKSPIMESFQPRPLTAIERRQLDDLEFAEKYVAGEATDSMGNSITGGNPNWRAHGPVTALGPRSPRPKQRPDLFSHMVKGTLSDPTAPHNPVDSDEVEELRHPSHLKRKADMYQNTGLKKPSDQERKQVLDVAAISAAFRAGYSR
jgi:excisionase family DNA binding protein